MTGDLYGCAVRALDAAPQSVPPCPVCGATAARPRFAVEGTAAPVVVCESCGLGRFHPMLDATAIASLYPDAYYGEPRSSTSAWTPLPRVTTLRTRTNARRWCEDFCRYSRW